MSAPNKTQTACAARDHRGPDMEISPPAAAPWMATLPWRSGNAMIATLIVAITVGLAANLASSNVMSISAQQQLMTEQQQARYAAEAVAATVEAQLSNTATTTTALSQALVETNQAGVPTPNGGWVWGLPGYCNGTASGLPATSAYWFGNCLVRWRVEPVKVWSETMVNATTPPSDPAALYTTNMNTDPNNQTNQNDYLKLQSTTPMDTQNQQYFQFRIIAQAYYLKPGLVPGTAVIPWANPGHGYSVCSAQATRIIQMNQVNLFQYAIFYAAASPVGDLEMWQGSSMSVAGRVHSNGNIFIGGGGNAYNSGAYHDAASGNASLSIGTSTSPTMVTSAKGIYRMRKGGNITFALRNSGNPILSTYANPANVPLDGVGAMTGENDLDGDSPSSTLHSFNGVAFNSADDSRSPSAMIRNFKSLVLDGAHGILPVNTLANIPAFSGRPYEMITLGGSQQIYAPTGSGVQQGFSPALTINPTSSSSPVYYGKPISSTPPFWTVDPSQAYTVNGQPVPVTAQDLPLYYTDATQTAVDIQATAYPEYTSMYNKAAVIDATNLSGLVIRELPTQAVPNPSYPGFPTLPSTVISSAMASAYAAYLMSEYQVLFHGQDITQAFFGDMTRSTPIPNLTTVATAADLIVSEDMMINSRASSFLNVYYGVDVTNFNASGQPYKVNVLTINLRRIQDFIAYMPMSSLNPAFAAAGLTGNAKQYFNGIIYATRTRRSQSYNPILSPQYQFNPTSSTSPPWVAGSGSAPIPQTAAYSLPTDAYPSVDREGSGPPNTFYTAVRIRGGLTNDTNRARMSQVDWNLDPNNTGSDQPAPLGQCGLSVITPNQCYLWGDFNTTTNPNASGAQVRCPCAIFSDGITVLSAAWLDSSVVSPNSSSPPVAVTTTYIMSMVTNNIPTQNFNVVGQGSGAVANICQFLENWSGQSFNLTGSLVVLNSQRYNAGILGAGTCALNAVPFYSPPSRNITFNTDLLLQAGQPPASPFGMQTTRVVSTVDIINN